jgi:hypothetical protein
VSFCTLASPLSSVAVDCRPPPLHPGRLPGRFSIPPFGGDNYVSVSDGTTMREIKQFGAQADGPAVLEGSEHQ